MIIFIKENHYVEITHFLFDEDEYIYSDGDGIVWDEHGYLFENWYDRWYGANGIRLRHGGQWEDGWRVK